ncbi:hypothetical protein scyTo_0011675 [Scyliorhinus torazame]|uniref:Uncharacterized protein n=1 Tax=Scyliorhinus torazame TaxID=75743 RepID=A0A401NSM8_SCYTO|nr:hypothetical protein [Scyliorhinus torazame]
MNNFTGYLSVHTEAANIVELAKQVRGERFVELATDEAEELLQPHGEEPFAEDLVELMKLSEFKQEQEEDPKTRDDSRRHKIG